MLKSVVKSFATSSGHSCKAEYDGICTIVYDEYDGICTIVASALTSKSQFPRYI